MMRIGFVGIGLMGEPMVRRLLDHGFEVTVWNRTASKCRSLVDLGAKQALNLEDVSACSVIITMLADGAVVEEIVAQLSPFLNQSHLLIDMSSTSLKEVQRISDILVKTGAHFIDAPVSGGVKGAEEGSLAIMAGSEDLQTFDRAKCILRAMGRPVRVGEIGAGQLSKLANQAIVGGTIGIVSEAILLLEKAGVDPDAFRDALSGGFADSTILQLHGKRMSERSFEPGGKVKTQLKDERNILEASSHFELKLPITQAIHDRYQELDENMGKADLDHSALFLQLLKINNLV